MEPELNIQDMKRILVIEDNTDVRENIVEMLELEGHKVTGAENGKIGLEKVKDFKPDLIVCDIMMPVMDGYTVLQELEKDHGTSCIPFIFLSAKADRTDMRLGMNLGADDYLTKPFQKKELLDAIGSRIRKNDFLKNGINKTFEGLHNFFADASLFTYLEGLTNDRELRTYEKKESIFKEGQQADKLYFIGTGTIKTFKIMESGKEFVTGIWGPGDFIGQLSLLSSGGTYTENATVMEHAELSHIAKKDFTSLLYGNPIVSQKFIDMISNNLVEIQGQLIDMAFSSVRQRAARALLYLFDKGMLKTKVSMGIGIPRDDFAGIIGTAKETAVRILTDFKNEGLIAMDSGRRIILLNPHALRAEAGFDGDLPASTIK